MALEVFPEDLPVIGAQLGANQASLAAVLTSAGIRAVPGISGADSVNAWIVAKLIGYQASLAKANTTGLAYMHDGGVVLGPISVAYRASDIAGGAEVDTQGAALAG